MIRRWLFQRISEKITGMTEKYNVPPEGNEKYMIVLGAKMNDLEPSLTLRFRLDCASDYALSHPELLIITSGGQGKNEIIPEGEGMKRYLASRGIDGSRILAENRSTSTRENFAYSMELMKSRGYDTGSPIIYVTNDYHCYRAGQYAEMEGFADPRGLYAATPEASALNNYLRESVSLIKLFLVKIRNHLRQA